MNAVLYILIVLLVIKIGFNFLLPYIMGVQWLLSKKEKSESTSLGPFVEIVLFPLAVGASSLAEGSTWLHNWKNVALWGTIAILGSFVHFFCAALMTGWVVAIIKRRCGH